MLTNDILYAIIDVLQAVIIPFAICKERRVTAMDIRKKISVAADIITIIMFAASIIKYFI